MSPVKTLTLALPSQLVAQVREAVDSGDYTSSSELLTEALRDWAYRRTRHERCIEDLAVVWREAIDSKKPGVPLDSVFERLEQKYQRYPRSGSTAS